MQNYLQLLGGERVQIGYTTCKFYLPKHWVWADGLACIILLKFVCSVCCSLLSVWECLECFPSLLRFLVITIFFKFLNFFFKIKISLHKILISNLADLIPFQNFLIDHGWSDMTTKIVRKTKAENWITRSRWSPFTYTPVSHLDPLIYFPQVRALENGKTHTNSPESCFNPFGNEIN